MLKKIEAVYYAEVTHSNGVNTTDFVEGKFESLYCSETCKVTLIKIFNRLSKRCIRRRKVNYCLVAGDTLNICDNPYTFRIKR